MTARGEIWLAEAGGKRRPVVVLTRNEVIDVRDLVAVAEVTTTIRGLAAEVAIDHVAVGLDHACVINCDGLHTIARRHLTTRVGTLGDEAMDQVCAAVHYALGC